MEKSEHKDFDYKPINCTLYDNYTTWCTNKVEVLITSIDDSFLGYTSKIRDLYTRDTKEYVVTDHDIHHRADKIEITTLQ